MARFAALQIRVAAFEDLAHAAGAEGGENLIRAESSAGSEAHRFVTGAMRGSSSNAHAKITRYLDHLRGVESSARASLSQFCTTTM